MKRKSISWGTIIVLVLIVVLYVWLTRTPTAPGSAGAVPTIPLITNSGTAVPVTTTAAGGSPASIGNRTKTSGCQIRGPRQDVACTPGAIFPDATKDQICTPGYSKTVRNVPDAVKSAVYAEYGIKTHATGEYEVDHLISLELGGSNDISNLWPEAAAPKPGFHEKDQVENYLHQRVCSGAISLQQAQSQIANDWLAVYNDIPVNQLAPLTEPVE